MFVTPQSATTDEGATTGLIPVRDVGFTTLHNGGKHPKFDIVFIHGIQGHPINTWIASSAEAEDTKRKRFLGISRLRSTTTSQDQDVHRCKTGQFVPPNMWPASILSKDFPDARILTYGYDSRISNFFGGPANQNDMITIANGFLNDLASERVDARGRPLMVISHSMGGLITKEALRRASIAPTKDEDLRDVLKSTIALLFFGTPHRGGAYTNLGLTATKIVKATGFSVHDRNIRDLKGSSPVLTLIREGFAQLLDSDTFEVSTFQESLGYSGFGLLDDKIVPNESSEIGHVRNERKNLINANHMNMCRFKNEHDDGYIKTRAEIKRHLARAQANMSNNHGMNTPQECISSFRIAQMENRVLQIDHAHRETLTWLYEEPGPGIAEWLRSGTGVFWIQGKAGSGKSTAMKFLLGDATTLKLLNEFEPIERWRLVGSFFTDRAERIQSSWNGILHSMIHQLLLQCPSLVNIAQEAFQGRTSDSWSTDALEQLLLSFKSCFGNELRVCFLIDALDEHDGQHGRMVDFLHVLVATSTDFVRMKVCVASRPHNDLKDLLVGDSTLKIQDWTRNDVDLFVAGRLSTQPRWEAFKQDGRLSVVQSIQEDIPRRAQGVFLWVRLVVDELVEGIRDGMTLFELQNEVDKFPDGLNDFFGHILRRVKVKYHLEMIIIIETLLRSSEVPSQVFMLLVLLANTKIARKTESWSEGIGAVANLDTEGFVRRLQSRCGGLVEVVRTGTEGDWEVSDSVSVIQFLHQTVKEYFLERKNLEDYLASVKYLAPGVEQPNGHFFILQAYVFWLRLRSEERHGFQVDLASLPKKIITHSSAIEFIPNVLPTHLLVSLDLLMSKQSENGMLWPISFDTNRQLSWLNNPKPFRQGQAFMMTAVAFSLDRYVQENLTDDMSTSIRKTGIAQFGYLTCRSKEGKTFGLLEGAELLFNTGIDVKSCRNFTIHKHAISLDALGVFVSSHGSCDWQDQTGKDNSHMHVFYRLLQLGADPCGYCVLGGKTVRLAEMFSWTSAKLNRVQILDHLWELCCARSQKIGDLFGKGLDEMIAETALRRCGSAETFRWLFRHGGMISQVTAQKIYWPLQVGLNHHFGDAQTYAEVAQSFSGHQTMLDRSLVYIYEHEMKRYVSSTCKLLLEEEFRDPRYYHAAARRIVLTFNPKWIRIP